MKTINLVSISFPGRDLCLGPVSVKSYSLKDKEIARNFRISVSQFDLGTPINDIVENLTRKGADIYGFTAYVWNINDVLEISERLKKNLPETVVVLGGPEASGMAKTLMED